MKKIAFILTDFRVELIAAIIHLSRDSSDYEIVIPESAIKSNEYGSFSSRIIKKMKLHVLGYIRRVVIVKTKAGGLPNDFGVMSSLISHTRDTHASKEKYPQTYGAFEENARCSIAVTDYVNQGGFTDVVIYNGRLSSTSLIVGNVSPAIKTWFTEVANLPFHFSIYDFPCFAWVSLFERVISMHESGTGKSISFVNRRLREGFRRRKLDNFFAKQYSSSTILKYEVSIFLSSSHEFASLGGLIRKSDLEFAEEVCKRNFGSKIAIRLHPNQVQDPSVLEFISELKKKCKGDVEILHPSSPVNSYNLILQSRSVFVNHSSISVDAFLLGVTPSVSEDSLFGMFINYVTRTVQGGEAQKDLLIELCCLAEEFGQVPLHPFYAFAYRLLLPFDRLVTEYVDVARRPKLK